MIVQTIKVNDCTPQTIVIGRRGTYDTLQIAFDLSYLVESYGNGVAVLAVKRSQDESAYPAVTAQEDDLLLWTVSETDTFYPGLGECELMWYVDGGLAKTIIYPCVVMKDILATSEEAPDAYQEWVDSLIAEGAETLQNAQNAAQSASDAESAKDDAVTAKEAAEEAATKAEAAVVHAPIIQNGFWYIWSDDQYVNTNVRAEGEKGDKGDTGEKGDTGNGIASITKTGTSGLVDTYTVTYTDGTTTTFTVTNGAKGDKGDTGATGNGIQSITKTGTSGNVDTYTITYTNGQTTTFTVTNGAVTSVAGKTGAVVLDSGDIEFDDSETYQAGSVGAELSDLTRHLSDVEENQIPELKNAIGENEQNIENIINLNRPDDVFTLGNFVGGTMYNGVLQPSNKKCITSTDSFNLMQNILLGAFISQANTDGTRWKVRFSFFASDGTYLSQVGYGDYNGEFTDLIPAAAATFHISLSLYEGSTNPDITPDDYTSERLVGLRFMYKQTYATEEEIGVIPQNLTQYDYYGDRIDIRPKKIAFKWYLKVSNITSVNGSAVYGDYLFTAKAEMNLIAITNMKTKTFVQTISFTAVSTYHCNNINFGNEKYDPDDPFPLLYVSMENSSQHKAVVLRITESGGTYSATEVQTITYPENATAGMYYQNCYIDTENSYLYISGASQNSFIKGNGNKLIVKKYNLPLLAAGNVQLTNADVLSSFEIEMITAPQGGFILGGKLIQAFGYGQGADQTKHICMIDLNLGRLATDIRLDKYGITDEPEAVFMWDGGLYMMDSTRNVTRVYV